MTSGREAIVGACHVAETAAAETRRAADAASAEVRPAAIDTGAEMHRAAAATAAAAQSGDLAIAGAQSVTNSKRFERQRVDTVTQCYVQIDLRYICGLPYPFLSMLLLKRTNRPRSW